MDTIYTVTSHYLKDTQSLFPKHKVRELPKDFSGISADLIIFTGGEDVNPSLYRGGDNHPGWATNPRDTRELEVLRAIRRGRLNTKKVLGICRGIQLLNVGMGGSLVFDIPTRYGKRHSYVHPLRYTTENIFISFLKIVNSLHHQCIEVCGEALSYRILAIEPETGSIEMVVWEDKYLGMQFHPELFPNHRPEKRQISETIEEWVDGKINIVGGQRKRSAPGDYKVNPFIVSSTTTNAEPWWTPTEYTPPEPDPDEEDGDENHHDDEEFPDEDE